jgi:hypothetical protein
MLTHPIQADGLMVPAVRGMTAGSHWSKRSALAMVLGLSALCWVGFAEIINLLA